jgi:hypothetical protein
VSQREIVKRLLSTRNLAVMLAVSLLATPASTRAAIGTIDTVPAATLLLPYFEVDLANPNGPVTVFQVMNRSANSTLAQVTLWTDLGVPTYTFDIYMSGHDQVEVDLRLLFNGNLPQTSNTLSNRGAFSTPLTTFPNCSGALAQGRIPPDVVTSLRNAHTGQASLILAGNCGGTVSGNVARGYITIDSANQCSSQLPNQPGYFVSGGLGIANNNNVLSGEYWFNDRANNFAYGDTLVHIEASGTDPLTTTPGKYTFYGRILTLPGSAVDNREALPTNLLARYVNSGTFSGTDALVWRDPGARAQFGCAFPPAGLTRRSLGIFDERENVAVVSPLLGGGFPRAAQRVNLADPAQIPIPFSSGFLFYDLNLATAAAPFGGTNQGWVSHVFRANGRFAGLVPGWAYDNASAPFAGIFGFFGGNCADGIDNDGDGQTDFPADPGCADGLGIENPQCSNGIDDDGDTFVDFPLDPQCASVSDFSEVVPPPFQCGDHLDNDGDGLIDFPADPGCTSLTDNSELNALCNNGIDDDGDGLTDFPADPGCANVNSSPENPQCNNGSDDDGDGQTDLADSGCSSASDNSELIPQCSDGIDNDGDGKIDFPADHGCTSANDNTELGTTQCTDDIDNDGDGLIDFPAETGCANAGDNVEAPDCSDTFDNDGDGFADFPADPGCTTATDLNEKAGTAPRACSDGVDNDGDGLTDYPADTGCISRYDDNEVTPN